MEENGQISIEEKAATRIQALYRGNSTRKLFSQKKRNAKEERPAKQDAPEEKRAAPFSTEDEAAVRVQALFRGRLERQQLEAERIAATRIQAVYRGHKTRSHSMSIDSKPVAVRFTEDDLIEEMEVKVEEESYHSNVDEEDEEGMEELTADKVEELLRITAEEQEQLQSRNNGLQKKLAQYLSTKKTEEPQRPSEKSVVDMEKLYKTNLRRVREQRKALANLESELDRKTLEMKERLDEKEILVQEGTKALAEFKRMVTYSAEHHRTAKPLSRQVIQNYENIEESKTDMVQKVRLRYITLHNRFQKLESRLRQKEDLGEGLHLIDFQQLKIENHSLAEKIEERNEEVLKLRKKITHTVQMLTHLKEKQQFVQNENLELLRELHELNSEVTEKQQFLSQIKRERDVLRMKNAKLRQESGLMGKADLLADFEKRKNELEKKRTRLAELQSRHLSMLAEIHKLADPQNGMEGLEQTAELVM